MGSAWAGGSWVEREEAFTTESAEGHRGQALQRIRGRNGFGIGVGGSWVEREEAFTTESAEGHRGAALQRIRGSNGFGIGVGGWIVGGAGRGVHHRERRGAQRPGTTADSWKERIWDRRGRADRGWSGKRRSPQRAQRGTEAWHYSGFVEGTDLGSAWAGGAGRGVHHRERRGAQRPGTTADSWKERIWDRRGRVDRGWSGKRRSPQRAQRGTEAWHYSGFVEGTDLGSAWAGGSWVEREEAFTTESAEGRRGLALQRIRGRNGFGIGVGERIVGGAGRGVHHRERRGAQRRGKEGSGRRPGGIADPLLGRMRTTADLGKGAESAGPQLGALRHCSARPAPPIEIGV